MEVQAPPPCWSNIVKQQPPKQPQPQQTAPFLPPSQKLVGSCSSTKGIAVAVVDANALIQGGEKLFHSADRFVSVAEVISEIRDPASRHALHFLPFTVDTLEPSPDALKKGVCRESERMALLKLKAEFIDDNGRLSSWESTNCCYWKGVICDNLTNHVVALYLNGFDYAYAPLRGTISPSLVQLSRLRYLDLSDNDFDGTTIPNFIGSLSKLRYLSMHNSNFSGQIPHHIGNLSRLHHLDLSFNQGLKDTNLNWLSGSPSLQYLDLSSVNLSGSTTWLQVIEKLTALEEIYLSGCQLAPVAPVSLNSSSSNSLVLLGLSYNHILDSSVLLWFLNMSSSFTHIDFSWNHLEGGILGTLGNLTNLSYLDLSHNQLEVEFPRPFKNSSSFLYLDLSYNMLNQQLSHLLTWLWDSTSLQSLSLSGNVLSGSFPNMSRFSDLNSLYLWDNRLNGTLLEDNLRLPKLEHLDLSTNRFSGRLPNLSSSPSLVQLFLTNNMFNGSLNIGHLSELAFLNVGYNQLEGVITEANLSSFPHLISLSLSFNLNISIRINPSRIHHVRFGELQLAYCKLGPHFPEWLRKQNQLFHLDISNSGIIDAIPSWFWGNIRECGVLNMSHNQIHGVLPDLSSIFRHISAIDLSYNQFSGSLPPIPSGVFNLYFSRNKFSGTILNFCNFTYINIYAMLDLSNNLLSGEIPQDCFKYLLGLDYVNLANNNLSGELPSTNNLECHITSLVSLHLRNNSFRGEIPRSLMNCSALTILDLAENEFNGKLPVWLGERMPNLGVLILKSYGSLPSTLCRLSYIQVLDISSNKIAGTIPNCMNNFFFLSSQVYTNSWNYTSYSNYMGTHDFSFCDSASIIWKGYYETYFRTLGQLKMIDLSRNQLFGEIPPQLTTLSGLFGLNLSRNNLLGFIPEHIDQMKLLNFLDLSRNNLSGGIPPTLSKLSHLGVLNLSFNNLSGRIPWDTHMQTFEASTYLGNPRLCGPPLLERPCPEDEKPTNGEEGVDSEDEDKLISRGFYISMLLGFIAAFWIVFWTLFFNKWWNAFSSKICMSVVDCVYVHIFVNKRRLLRYILRDA